MRVEDSSRSSRRVVHRTDARVAVSLSGAFLYVVVVVVAFVVVVVKNENTGEGCRAPSEAIKHVCLS